MEEVLYVQDIRTSREKIHSGCLSVHLNTTKKPIHVNSNKNMSVKQNSFW